MITPLQTIDDVVALLPPDTRDIKKRTQELIDTLTQKLNEIGILAADKRSFDNTARAFDQVQVALRTLASPLQVLELTSPNAEMRIAAHTARIELQNFAIDHINNNNDIYRAFKEYALHAMTQEPITNQERYFIHEVLKNFRRSGLDLPDIIQEKIRKLKKEIATLELSFETNINTDHRTVAVSREQLAGLSNDFIQSLKQTDDGLYILGVDYPTYHQVLDHCDNESTREKLWTAFVNRAYPANTPILTQLISTRNKLAHLLGYSSYAEFDISDEMAKSPKHVEKFLENMGIHMAPYISQEIAELKRNLPPNVTITADGKFKPSDIAYCRTYYKEKYFMINERYVAEYFPLEHTLNELLNIFGQFFNIKLSLDIAPYFWHPDVKVISAHNPHDQLLGYILLDLFPRPNKYTHAAQFVMVPSISIPDRAYIPSLSTIIANLPAPTDTHPSLLAREDVYTLFHEFGHALHTLLGATEIGTLSGTCVKQDFVEMPSQMLVEWLWNPHILKRVSSHYQTHEPLPDEMIDKLLKTKHFDMLETLRYRLTHALVSLDYYKDGEHKDIYSLANTILACVQPYIFIPTTNHFSASFGHLTEYGAKYYSYLWSLVYAYDVFSCIKQFGLLNPEIGKRYREKILSKGGTEDPYKLLVDFLGREPNSAAFFKDLGL